MQIVIAKNMSLTKITLGAGCFEFHLLISGKYVLKPEKTLCSDQEHLANVDECKMASWQLNLFFSGTTSSNEFPTGCFRHKVTGNSIWKQKLLYSKNIPNANAQPICNAGKSFQLSTTNLL